MTSLQIVCAKARSTPSMCWQSIEGAQLDSRCWRWLFMSGQAERYSDATGTPATRRSATRKRPPGGHSITADSFGMQTDAIDQRTPAAGPTRSRDPATRRSLGDPKEVTACAG